MGKRVNAFTNDAIGRMDAYAIAQAIAKRELSPQEVTEACIARLERVNPELNALVMKWYDTAREKTKQPAQGGLWGVPTVIKDSDPVEGYPTQMGTRAFTAKKAPKHGKYIAQFLSTGLIPLGKSTMPEFGLICSAENPAWGITRNPWDTDYTSGGSSSGSASLVASGAVPIALANDGAGSIRIPAAICGLVGLKASRHRVYGVEGAKLMPLEIIHQGVVTRSVRDTALFFAEAEKNYRSKKLEPLGMVETPLKKRLKIAFFHNLPAGKPGHQDEDTYRSQTDTAKLLESLGHRVEQVTLPADIDAMIEHFLHYYGFLAYILTEHSKLLLKAKVDTTQLEPFTVGLSQRFKSDKLKLIKSLNEIKRIGKETEALFSQFDVIMTPVVSHKTPKIGYFSPTLSFEEIADRAVRYATYTGLQNVTGSPAISLPLSTDADGMPLGVQFSAAYGQDRLLLELAYEVEQAAPWKIMGE